MDAESAARQAYSFPTMTRVVNSARVVSLSAWAAVTAVAAWVALSFVTIENPRGLWTVSRDPPEHQLWVFAQDQFRERDILLVAFRVPPGKKPEVEPAALALQRWIEDQPEVTHVLGLAQLQAVTERLGLFGGALLADLRGAVIGAEGKTALMYVVLAAPAASGSLEITASFIARLHDASKDLLPAGATLDLAGQPAIDIALDRLLGDDFSHTVPVALAVVGVVLVLLIGRMSLAAVVAVAAALVLLLGAMGTVGLPVSSATAVALPLTVIVGISYAGHVALAVARTGDRRMATREIRAPLTWSYLTRAVALGSFALSPIRALRLFALASCVGLTVAFVAALTLTPYVVVGQRRAASRRARRLITGAGVRVFAAAVRHRTATFSLWLAVVVLIGIGVFRARVEPNSYLGFFPDGHPIGAAYNELDDSFGGSVQLQVLARVDSGVAYQQDRVRARLMSFLRSADTLMQLGPSIVPPPPRSVRGDANLQASVTRWFEGQDACITRAMFAVPIMATTEAQRVIGDLEELAVSLSDQHVALSLTGLLPASLPMQHMLIDLMVQSLGLLAVFVLLSLTLAARSIRDGLMLLLPNGVAVLAVVATMGYAGIPIDFTTVSVTALVLGVAVDDTLQLAWAGRAAGGRSYSPSRAVGRTAAAVLLSTLAMVAGALALAASPFPPTQRLGGLLAVGLVVALLADLTVTPLLIGGWVGRRRRGGGQC
jgi:predicted RND superfamily exporter protein